MRFTSGYIHQGITVTRESVLITRLLNFSTRYMLVINWFLRSMANFSKLYFCRTQIDQILSLLEPTKLL